MTNISFFFNNTVFDSWLEEDIGYFDLTSTILNINQKTVKMSWIARNEMTVACSEEVSALVSKVGGQVMHIVPSGKKVDAGGSIVTAVGPTQGLLNCWKVAQNLLEYACSVATRTDKLCVQAKQKNPDIGILTTRKTPPGLRKIAQKAAIAGGAAPHRLTLSETILIFPQHRKLLSNDWDCINQVLNTNKGNLIEKKIVIEVDNLEEAFKAISAGADIIQFDKSTPENLKKWCPILRGKCPNIKIVAAGGIKLDNAQSYAATGVDALVTSSVYFGPPADIGVSVDKSN